MVTARRFLLVAVLLALLAGCTRYVEVAPGVYVVEGEYRGSVHYANYVPLWPSHGWAWSGAASGWPYHADHYRGWVGWSPYAHRYTSLYYPRYGWSPVWRSHWYYWNYGMAPRHPWVYEPPFNEGDPDRPGGNVPLAPWPGAVDWELAPVISLSPGWQGVSDFSGARGFEDRWFDRGRMINGKPTLQRRVQPAGVLDPTAGMVVRSRSDGKPGPSRTQPVPRPSRPTSVNAPRAPRAANRSPRPSRSVPAQRTTNRIRNHNPER